MELKLPLVVIVGRPNVGKSTLFNRLVGRRHAIVHPQEGITRDRIAEEVEWNGRRFRLEDTGGYLPQGEDEITAAVREQALAAAQEAQVVIFLLDARVGLTEEDIILGRMLRKSFDKVLVAANKLDTPGRLEELPDLYRLGWSQIFPISALNGTGVGDLLDAVIEKLPESKVVPPEKKVVSFAIVGAPNVGKSSLTNALLGQKRQIVTSIPGTTRDAVNATFKYYGRLYEMIDTAGLRRQAKIKDSLEFYSSVRTQRAIRRAEIVVLLLDVERMFTRVDAKVVEQVTEAGRGLVIAMNKWDLPEKTTHTMDLIRREIQDQLPELRHYPLVFISALKKRRLHTLMAAIDEVHAAYHRRISTSEANHFLEDALGQLQPPAVKGKKITIKYMTQAETAPPRFLFFTNHPRLITESYRKYLENKLRERFNFVGVPLRLTFRKK